MTTDPALSAHAAYLELVDHRHYAYRGCAPDPDAPRYSAADPDLPLDAWVGTTAEGGLGPAERGRQQRRAIAICNRCPVLAQCRTYALAPGGGGFSKTDGIQGGLTAPKRHRIVIERKKRKYVAAGQAQMSEDSKTAKVAVLQQLARETDAELVAYRAGMDLRTANWHRSMLCTLFGLDKEKATRLELLRAAVDHQLLPARTRIRPDGQWTIAAAPNTDGSRQRRLAPGRTEQTTIPLGRPTASTRPPHRRTTPAHRPHLTLVTPPAYRPVPLPLPIRTLEVRAA